MSNLIEIKKRIESITSTIKVTKVMQMIATAKIAKIKPMIGVVDRYNNDANEVLSLYLNNSSVAENLETFLIKKEENAVKNRLFILFSSDKGTCGGINTNIFKFATEVIKECQEKGQKITIFPVGKRAVKWLKTNAVKLDVNVYDCDGIVADSEYCNSEVVGSLTHKILQEYINGNFDEVCILSHKYKNIITCNVDNQKLLPIQLDKNDNKTIDVKTNDNNFINIDEGENTANAIIEFFVRTKIYNAYISNIASIVSSRMNAMDNATKNGQELIDELRIKYNKTRQASITAELSDIVSGSEALN